MTEGLPPPPPSDAPGPGWADAYAPPQPVGDVAAYLRANGTRYTRQVLDRRLLAAGHSPDTIAAAWATVEAEDDAAGRRDRRGQTAAIIAGAYGVTWLVVVLVVMVPRSGAGMSSVASLAAILAVALFVPGIIAVAIARSTRWLRRAGVGRVVAFAFVPMLILFALAGTCVSFVQSFQHDRWSRMGCPMTLPLNAWTPLRMVLTVCPRCFDEDPERDLDYEMDVLQGNLVAMDGKVYLRRVCRRGHGEVIGLYEENGALWEDLQQWRIPTRQIIPDRPANTRPIPMGYLDGLGDLQTQHSCLVLIDVTETCNLECPTCFAVSAPGVGRHAPEPAVMRTLDAAIAREGGKVDALMLSGGEPTVHPGILDLVRAATERNVTRVVLNTNGIRIARDDAFLGELAKLRDRVEIYLQFDGFRESTYRWHRGEDLRAIKDAAIRRLTDARIFTTLAVAVAKGVNEDEVGAIVDMALDTDYLAGVAIQPMFGSGRANAFDPMDRATTTGTIQRMGPQTGGRVSADDFIALPCSHPDCATLTYMIRADDGQYRSVVSMIGRDQLKEHMAVYGNRLAPDDALWEALTGMLSETALISRPELIDHLLDICEVCDLGVSGFVKTLGRWLIQRDAVPVEAIAKRVKRISIKTFMDTWTMNVERLQQCCVHVASTGDDEPVRIPFCARQAFAALRKRTSEGMVAARDLPVMRAAAHGEVRA